MGVKRVVAAGEWNGFAANGLELVKQPDGTFRGDVALMPGEYAYKLIVDGNWTFDSQNPYRKYVGGIENSDLRVDDCHAPLLALAAWSVDAAGHSADGVIIVQDGADARGIDWASLSVIFDGQAQPQPARDEARQRVILHGASLATGKHTFRVTVKDRGGRAARELYLPLWIEPAKFLSES